MGTVRPLHFLESTSANGLDYDKEVYLLQPRTCEVVHMLPHVVSIDIGDMCILLGNDAQKHVHKDSQTNSFLCHLE